MSPVSLGFTILPVSVVLLVSADPQAKLLDRNVAALSLAAYRICKKGLIFLHAFKSQHPFTYFSKGN